MDLNTFDYLEKQAANRALSLKKSLVEAVDYDMRLIKEAAASGQIFDVFLSHNFQEEKWQIWELKNGFEGLGLTVYVDWIDDPQMSRHDVTGKTADHLRFRMRKSGSL
jgi:hypothetical protein